MLVPPGCGGIVGPGQIHGYQSRVWRDPARLIVVKKSRRIGLTWALLGRSVWRSMQPNGPNTYYMSHTYDSGLEAMADVEYWADKFNLAATKNGRPQIWAGGKKTPNSFSKETARFASSSKFKVLSAKPRKARGIPGAPDYLIDEAAFHLESEEMIKAARAILMRPLGTVTVVSTVMYEDSFYEFYEETREEIEKYGPSCGKSVHTITFDDALNDGFMEREAWIVANAVRDGIATPDKLIYVGNPAFAAFLESVVGRDAVAMVEGQSLYRPHARLEYKERVWRLVAEPDRELNCIAASSGTQYMPKELIRRVLAEHCHVFRYEAKSEFMDVSASVQETAITSWMEGPGRELTKLRSNPGRRWYYGVDFGRSRDLTVISVGYIDGQILKVPFMLELDNVPFRCQRMFFDQVMARLDIIAGGSLDRGGPGAELAEHARVTLGEYRAERVTMTNHWYMEHMPPFKLRFQDGSIQIPDDPLVEGDLRQIKLVDGVPKIPRGERVNVGKALDGKSSKFRHGDGAISLVLLNYSARVEVANGGGGYEAQKVGLPPNRRMRGIG